MRLIGITDGLTVCDRLVIELSFGRKAYGVAHADDHGCWRRPSRLFRSPSP